jgi:uncharacterized protein (TIRG00374 family)
LKTLRYLIATVVGLALLAWAVKGLDLGQMGQAIQSADYAWLLPAGLAMLGMFALRALRWKLLLSPSREAGGEGARDVSFRALLSGVLIGYFGNFALTANAGELVRAFILGQRENRSKSAVLASIVVEKTLDILVLVGLLLLLSSTLTLPWWTELMVALGGLMFLAVTVLLVVLPRWEARIAAWIDAFGERTSASLAARAKQLLHNFIIGIQFPRQGRAVIEVIVLSCLIWPVLAVAFFFIGHSLGFSIAAHAYLLLVALITLGAIIPTLPGQIGTTEFLIVGGLSIFAVDKEQALAFVILLRLIRLLPLSLGYVSLLRAGLGLSEIKAIPAIEAQ